MKLFKKKEQALPMSLMKRIMITLIALAAVYGIGWLAYYFCHFVWYDGYEKFVGSYDYEMGTEYQPVKEAKPSVEGMELVCENEYLKLYTDTAMANVAVYDKRDGSITYACPPNADEDTKANRNNKTT